jgi:hypothetical protein
MLQKAVVHYSNNEFRNQKSRGKKDLFSGALGDHLQVSNTDMSFAHGKKSP